MGVLLPPALTFGFAAAVGMWLVGFVLHLPGLRAPAPAVGLLMLAVLVLVTFRAGRASAGVKPALLGAASGLIASALNLLIVGSVLASGESANDLRGGWGLAILGTLVFGAVVGAAAGFAGGRRGVAASGTRRRWLPSFAMVAVASAIPVLLSGGLVTSTGTGLAVPDWPTSYNANMFLYPLSKMTGGIYYEHAHRLFGSLVGLTTLTLAAFTLIADRRTLQRVLAVGALLFVGFQGVLGGMRVTSATVVSDQLSPATLADNKGSVALAAFHGVSAQVFIAFLCLVACVLSERWRRSESEGSSRADSGLRSGALLALLAIIGQLALGSVSRHFQQPHAAYTHAVFGLVVLSLCCVAGFRAAGRHRDEPVLKRLGPAVSHTSILQFLLGVATFLAVLPYEKGKVDPAYAVVIATAHQGLGAVLLSATAMLTLWSRRLLSPVTARETAAAGTLGTEAQG